MVSERESTSLPTEEVLLTHAQVLLALGKEDEAQNVLDDALHRLNGRAEALPEEWQSRFWTSPVRQEMRAVFEAASASKA